MNPDVGLETLPSRSEKNIFNNQGVIFHGIGFDTLSLPAILQHGILSKVAADKKGIGIVRNYHGTNLDDKISYSKGRELLSEPSAFREYIRQAISIVAAVPTGAQARKALKEYAGMTDEEINQEIKNPTQRAQPSQGLFPGEGHVSYEVPQENIRGIMVPEGMLARRISELPLGFGIRVAPKYVDDKCRAMIDNAQAQLGYQADTTKLDALLRARRELGVVGTPDQDERRQELVGEIEAFMRSYLDQAYSKYFKKKTVTLRDVIESYIPEGMPVYNIDGEPIDIKQEAQPPRVTREKSWVRQVIGKIGLKEEKSEKV